MSGLIAGYAVAFIAMLIAAAAAITIVRSFGSMEEEPRREQRPQTKAAA